ncbi:MAG TPA: deoxyguanosinetriphosphate triphosphohydrolase, partial [Mycobacteriales bacterium]|nr:deoxyguanosinetriphosphate triphosphohydrolase [Mycobacteriales bacterium]
MAVVDGYADADRARWVQEPPKASRAERGAFERDRARVLHSAALRRLAAKTQVVGVGESDFPRTRLTHSLECAQIGRELAAALGMDPDLVDAACLAHDLGHPPFGHNGEVALAEFADGHGGFEGNAQSLRVLTRLEAKVVQPDGVSAGLNLTRAALDAATKYPWPRTGLSATTDACDATGSPASAGTAHKFGYYADDRSVFDWMRADAPAGRRCVEAQVMDWADDVAYSVHDLEDGIHAGHVDVTVLGDRSERAALVQLAQQSYSAAGADDLAAAAERLAALPFWPRGFDGTVSALAALKRMTSELIGRFTAAATAATREAHGAVPLTRYRADLVVPAAARDECAILKAVAARYVMQRPQVRAV